MNCPIPEHHSLELTVFAEYTPEGKIIVEVFYDMTTKVDELLLTKYELRKMEYTLPIQHAIITQALEDN